MSGLAHMMIQRGVAVSGYDRKLSHLTDRLIACGARVSDDPEMSMQGARAVVATAAIARDDPQMRQAHELGLPVIARAKLLALLMEQSPCGVGICGTHGKTTTTAMAATALLACDTDPSIHIGGELAILGGTTRMGQGDIFLTEADEYAHSFLQLDPRVAVVTNIEHDHPDVFPTMAHMLKAFTDFFALLPADGTLIYNTQDANAAQLAAGAACKIVGFSVEGEAEADAQDLQLHRHGSEFIFVWQGTRTPVRLRLPGRYNIENATAAMTLMAVLGLDLTVAAQALGTFDCAGRRFEDKGKTPRGARVILDYAHHPTAVRSLLCAARQSCVGKIYLAFQPHTYSRTRALMDDFAAALREGDHTYITPIWAAREADDGTRSEDLAAMAGAEYAPDFAGLAAHLRATAGPEDLVLAVGAGDVDRLAELLVKE